MVWFTDIAKQVNHVVCPWVRPLAKNISQGHLMSSTKPLKKFSSNLTKNLRRKLLFLTLPIQIPNFVGGVICRPLQSREIVCLLSQICYFLQAAPEEVAEKRLYSKKPSEYLEKKFRTLGDEALECQKKFEYW